MIKKIFLMIFLLMCISNVVSASKTQIDRNESMLKLQDTDILTETISKSITSKNKELINFKSADFFSTITDCCERAKYKNVSDYIKFIYENNLSFFEIETINKILLKGTTIQSLSQVYDFWLTTDESFDMIEEICALEDNFFGEYWYEDVFNYLTNNSHGVMTIADIEEYRDKGVTDDEILTANILCRKKGQNIYDILESSLNGLAVSEQAKQLYGLTELPKADTLFDSVNQVLKQRKYSVPLVLNLVDVNKYDILNIWEQKLNELVEEKVSEELKKLDITVADISVYEDMETLKKSMYPVGVQNALLNKGYTPREIEISASIPTRNLNKAIKSARRIAKNEK